MCVMDDSLRKLAESWPVGKPLRAVNVLANQKRPNLVPVRPTLSGYFGYLWGFATARSLMG